MDTILSPSAIIPDTTIFDLLNINSRNIDRALRVLDYSSSENEMERVLFKQNENKVLIFDRIEIRKYKTDDRPKVYLKKKSGNSSLLKLKNLIDKMYSLYGEDDFSKRKFALNDLLDAHHGEEVCREWNHTLYPVNISYTKGKAIEMVIYLS